MLFGCFPFLGSYFHWIKFSDSLGNLKSSYKNDNMYILMENSALQDQIKANLLNYKGYLISLVCIALGNIATWKMHQEGVYHNGLPVCLIGLAYPKICQFHL